MSLEYLQHELQQLITATRGNRITAYFEIASIALLVYDYLLSLKLEADLIWRAPWSISKILFLLTRYSVFVDCSLLGYLHLSNGKAESVSTCRILYQLSGWMVFVGVAIAEFVLIFRTWAVWGRNSKIAATLLVFLLSLGIPTTYLTYCAVHSVAFIKSPIPHIHRCFLAKIDNKFLFWDYVVIMIVETVVLILTLIKGVYYYRHTKSNLVSTLCKDGLLYYIYLTVLSIANVATIAFPAATHGTALILLQRVFHSIFTARIILHLRFAAVKDIRDATMSPTPPVFTSLIICSQEEQSYTNIIEMDAFFCSSDTSHSNIPESNSVR